MATAPPELDPALWFMHLGCPGRHYLLGNPHIVPGRMWAWCPRESCTHFVSRADIGRMPRATTYWLAGFLHGNEPAPPPGPDGPPDHGSTEYKRWRARARQFQRSGRWPAKT